eukprot:scaffold421243_cov52-Attheya_sp.AAC.6
MRRTVPYVPGHSHVESSLAHGDRCVGGSRKWHIHSLQGGIPGHHRSSFAVGAAAALDWKIWKLLEQ